MGAFDVAKKLASEAEIIDYGDNYIYPGFIETHAHGFLAANRLELQADLSQDKSMAASLETMKKYIEDHPGRDLYEGAGWDIYDEIPTRQLLDSVNDEIPICLNSETKTASALGLNSSIVITLPKIIFSTIKTTENHLITNLVLNYKSTINN